MPYELKIPKLRVGCLIGKKGEVKRIIERSTKTKIKITSEGDVEIYGESLDGFICENIVKAIGRGFNPHIALNLIHDDYGMEIIDLRHIVGNNRKKLKRVKSRLIGTRGKARDIIEKLTQCYVSIYGRTVSIIGVHEKLSVAFRGIEKLLHGSPHGFVYAYLGREMKKLRD